MSMSRAFDGFIAITGILCIAWFLLAIQLGLISLDSTYKNWHKILNGTGRFPAISYRANSKTTVYRREHFFANKKLDLTYYNLTDLKPKLYRKRDPHKTTLIYVDLFITGGGFVLWLFMFIALCFHRLEKFFSCCRGLFPILLGLFFFICAVGSLVICILTSIYDLDDYDHGLKESLKLAGQALPAFYLNHTDAQEAKKNCDGCDNNGNNTVRLSPQTWFLIILECLIKKGEKVDDVLNTLSRGNKTDKNFTEYYYAIHEARAWQLDSKPLVNINGSEYSRWMLTELHFCPEDVVKQGIHGFLALVLIVAPLVAINLWKTYGRKPHEKKKVLDKEPVLTESQPEVIGSNHQMAELIIDSPQSPEEEFLNFLNTEEEPAIIQPVEEVQNEPKIDQSSDKPKVPEKKKKT